MAYRIAGRYNASCDCRLLCPCPVDGKPTGRDDQCHGIAIFDIRDGNLDDTDLSGSAFALYNQFSSNISAGNWKVGIIVDEGASDEQAQAIERIVSGQEGGAFADFAPLIGEYLGMSRARLSMSDSGGSASGHGEWTFEPLTGPDGSPTTVKNGMFAFAPEYGVGRSSGPAGESAASYGELADFEYSSEMAGEIHPRG